MIILGGIGFPILVNFKHIAGYHLKRLFYFIRTGKRDRQRIRHLYNLNTKIVLLTTLILLTGGTIAILLFEWNGAFAGMSMPDKWVQAFFNATCPRTAGFTSIGLTSFSLQSLLLMLLLMFIGGAAQSTAGGVKVNAFAAAVLSLFAVIRGKSRVEVFRRQLSVDSIRRSNATLVMYLMILFLGVFVLSVLEPHASLLALVFECTSALSTVGSSLGLTPALGEAGKLFVSLLMFIGRVGVITIVLGFVPPQKHTKYKYPDDFEEFINILKSSFYEKLPLNDFDGKNLVYLTSCTGVNLEAVKLLFTAQNSVYAANAVEEEIVATSAIESIDFDRSSVRSIILGNAPKNNQENRIYGLKLGFEFISDRHNHITEENIHKLYMMAIGNFLEGDDRLRDGEFYRHDDVYVMGGDGVVHRGIGSGKLPGYMKQFADFANADDGINDLLKAAMLHFDIAYLHPYFDGNGRMARLLHMWFLIQKGYESTLFVPMSSYIEKSRGKYYDAYTLVENNARLRCGAPAFRKKDCGRYR